MTAPRKKLKAVSWEDVPTFTHRMAEQECWSLAGEVDTTGKTPSRRFAKDIINVYDTPHLGHDKQPQGYETSARKGAPVAL